MITKSFLYSLKHENSAEMNFYSCRSDSMGSMLAARYAGYKPNVIPTIALIPKANTNEVPVIIVGIWPK